MLQKNETVRLEITGLTNEGSGVGRADGVAVFVPRTAPGDEIEARIVKTRTSYAYGIAERIIKRSPLRVENSCPVFSRCGGCALRHISYAAELEHKAQWVRENFARIGGLSPLAEPILASPQPERYRNKAQFPVRLVNGKVQTGFFCPRSHRLAPVEDCLLQPEFFSDICRVIRLHAGELQIPPYDELSHTGLLRHICIRYAQATAQTLVCLVLNGDRLPEEDALADKLAAVCPGELSVCVSVNTKKTNVVMGDTIRTISGNGKIIDILCGVRLSLSPRSFYQVNRQAAELLYQTAIEYAQLDSRTTVLDLYCGAGAIGLAMAGSAGRIIGVESVRSAVEDAKANALRGGISNAEFICADVAKAAEILGSRSLNPDVVVVDPPRKGVERAALDWIASLKPDRIVYASCDSATLARDCAILSELGYHTERYRPVDLFPRTAHVEMAALIENRN